MNDGAERPEGRAEYHQRHQVRAVVEAERLMARREQLQGAWLAWVAAELYQLGAPAFVAMVRRELERLSRP
ncbi:TPA: hypothetical protein ACKP22_001063 [Pseudomonas putida]